MSYALCCVDFETYYDDDYSLKKMSTTDYIRDPRYKTQSVCLGWEDGRIDKVPGSEAAKALRAIDWGHTAAIAHHTQFDGLILTHHYGCYPAFWYDTLSMARSALGTDASMSLNSVAKALGFEGKCFTESLDDVKGVRDLSPVQIQKLLAYNAHDVEQTLKVFNKLLPYLSDRELHTIDTTLRMYAEPVLVLDHARIQRVLDEERAHKRALFSKVEGAEWLSSAKAMAERLEALGVTPPTKTNAKGKTIFAFSKSDIEFKALLDHPVDAVRDLVEARLAVKSTLVETRSEAILRRVGLPTPIYLNYWGARTGRWSGGDSVNWQNLPRRGRGAELRKSLMAPAGHTLVIADASQIEARLLAWCAGEQAIVDAFARDEDVYALTAEMIYGRSVDPEVDVDERFVGKVFTLGAGYGAGAPKIHYMLRVGQFGPPVQQSFEKTQDQLNAWRTARFRTVNYWKQLERLAQRAFLMDVPCERDPIGFELSAKGDGLLRLPDGAVVRYPKVYANDEGQMAYCARHGDVKLYGGIITENIIQALATRVLVEHMDRVCERAPYVRIATTTHDEMVIVTPISKTDEVLHAVKSIMSDAPAWAEGLPLNAKVHASRIYDKM